MTLKEIKNSSYILVAIALGILFFYPVLFSGKTFFLRDIHQWFYPMKFFLANSLKAGAIPFWCPNYFCGSPFMSDIQSGVFYPLSVVFLLFSFPLSFNIYVVAHFFLAFIFFYNFIVGLGLSKKSALITSISFCYGSYTIASVNTLNNLSTLIWLPAILWSFHKARVKAHTSGYFLTVVFLCMAALGGAPQIFLLIVGLLFFFGITCTTKESCKTRDRLTTAGIILLLMVCVALLTMVQLGPTYLDYQHSMRLGGFPYVEAKRYSLDLDTLKHLFLPLKFDAGFVTSTATELKKFFPGNGEMPWLLTIYPGLIISILALLGFIFSSSKNILLWFITFVVTIALALGNATPVHYFFYKLFPFFRFPEKFMLLAHFSLLVIAAYGFDRFFHILKRKGIRHRYLFHLIVVLLIGDLFLAHRNINPVCESAFYQTYDSRLQPVLDDPETFRIYVDPLIKLPATINETIVNVRIASQMFLVPHLGILQDLDHVAGHTPLELLYQYVIRNDILTKPWEEKIRFLRLANVKYIISSQALDKNRGLMPYITKINSIVYKVNDALPRAWIVGYLLPIRQDSIDELVSPSFNAAFSALTKGDIVSKYNSPYFKEIDYINYEKNGGIRVELTADDPGVLVVSESAYPGWRVFVDGAENKCLYLNCLFLGVEIDKGSHTVVLRYRPLYFHFFLSISLVSLSLFFLAFICFGVFLKNGKKKT